MHRFTGAIVVFSCTKNGMKDFSYSGLGAFTVVDDSSTSNSSTEAIDDLRLELREDNSSGVKGGVDAAVGLLKKLAIRN